VDDPGDAAPRARLHGEDGTSATLRDEVLLQMLLQACGAPELVQLVGDALPAVAQLLPQLAKSRRGGVAQVRAVLLDAACDLLG